jgi:UDP-glucose 4-epimerase
MKKILVFGGNGFLGQYLVNELVSRKYSVDVADITDIVGLKANTFIKCNILDRLNIENIVCEGKYDIVYNLAGFANLDKAVHFPYETVNLNVLGNLNIMDACVKSGVKRFVFASSAYAMSNKGSFYGISKLASEKLIEEYQKRYALTFNILRYGSVYSELPFDNNYIYSLIEKAVKEKNIVHHGDGMELREYIHASDAAKLSADIIASNQFDNMHVILTGNEKMRRKELFELIKEILGDDMEIILKPDAESYHYRYTPYSFDPSVSRKLVANPHIDMGQGILECIRAVYKNDNIK